MFEHKGWWSGKHSRGFGDFKPSIKHGARFAIRRSKHCPEASECSAVLWAGHQTKNNMGAAFCDTVRSAPNNCCTQGGALPRTVLCARWCFAQGGALYKVVLCPGRCCAQGGALPRAVYFRGGALLLVGAAAGGRCCEVVFCPGRCFLRGGAPLLVGAAAGGRWCKARCNKAFFRKGVKQRQEILRTADVAGAGA